MLNKVIYALGIAALLYLVEAKGYGMGSKAAIEKFMEYAKNNPTKTFEDFLKEWEGEESK